MQKTTEKRLLKLIHGVDRTVDFALLLVILLLAVLGIYALWDADTVYETAKAEQYEIYKPKTEDATEGFEQLKALNPEVIGWLTVYGTGIDYPLVQADNNEKYVNTDVKGGYSMTGSLFLDCRNNPSYTDFNSIIYGHHMAKNAMFGSLHNFEENKFFEEHRYGALFCNSRRYGLEVFAFFPADAYDKTVYAPAMTGDDSRLAYIKMLETRALQKREIDVTGSDRIVLLSTCTADVTNGRYLLAAKITDHVPQDSFETEPAETENEKSSVSGGGRQQKQTPCIRWFIMLLLLLFLLVTAIYTIAKRYNKTKNKRKGDEREIEKT